MTSYLSQKSDYSKKIRVLITTPNHWIYGGVQNYVFNVLSHMNIENKQIDIYFSGQVQESYYLQKLNDMGINLYSGNEKKMYNFVSDYRNIRKLIKLHKYNILYVNTGFILFHALNYFAVFGNKKILKISHSHSYANLAIENKSFLKRIAYKFSRFFLTQNADYFLTCSTVAGNWLYGEKKMNEKGLVINNGIVIDKFLFSQTYRKSLRDAFGVDEDCYVLGLTAHFTPPKNHKFLFQVFSEFLKLHEDSRLLLLGGGDDKPKYEELAKKMQIDNKTIFMGNVINANEYYSAMDIFVMPSLHEGLCFVGIEAQTACLPCLFSDGVPEAVAVTGNAHFCSLQKSAKEWAENISDILEDSSVDKRLEQSKNVQSQIAAAGYDLKQSAEQIESIFDSVLKGDNND